MGFQILTITVRVNYYLVLNTLLRLYFRFTFCLKMFFISLYLYFSNIIPLMHLKFKSLTGKDKTIEIDSSATILEFKTKIYEYELIPPEQQRLVCNGKILGIENETLSYYKISSGNVIHMVLALRGGCINL